VHNSCNNQQDLTGWQCPSDHITVAACCWSEQVVCAQLLTIPTVWLSRAQTWWWPWQTNESVEQATCGLCSQRSHRVEFVSRSRVGFWLPACAKGLRKRQAMYV
jgi:hypothetical protein